MYDLSKITPGDTMGKRIGALGYDDSGWGGDGGNDRLLIHGNASRHVPCLCLPILTCSGPVQDLPTSVPG